MYEIEWTEYSRRDYESLDGSQKILVDKSLNRIKQRGMGAGKPCRNELAGCNRLKHRKADLRVIFRQRHQTIEIIQIVAIGRKDPKGMLFELRLPISKPISLDTLSSEELYLELQKHIESLATGKFCSMKL